MTEGVSSYKSLFANYAKLLKRLRNHKDCEENDIKMYELSKTWEIEFNAKKKANYLKWESGMRPTWTFVILTCTHKFDPHGHII